MPVRGEDTRDVVLKLLSVHLGVTDINKCDISACHRLKNPKVILVRFTHLNNSDRVYRARTKPKRHGLLIFESLTTERLSVIELLKSLKEDPRSPVLSYFTQTGKIFIKTSESRDVKPIEIPFGFGVDEIHELCAGRRVDPTDTAIRDQFRAIHGRGSSGGSREQSVRNSQVRNPWVTVRGNKNNRGAPPPPGRAAHHGRGGSGDGPPRDPHQSQGSGASSGGARGDGAGGICGSQQLGGSSVPHSGGGLRDVPAGDGSSSASSGDPSHAISAHPPADE